MVVRMDGCSGLGVWVWVAVFSDIYVACGCSGQGKIDEVVAILC